MVLILMPIVATSLSGIIAIFVFYNISDGIQSKLSFSKEFKHCNTITFDGRDWIALEFDKTGIVTKRVYTTNAESLLKHLPMIPEITAIICVRVAARHISKWSPWWVRSCNEVARYASGVDIGFTFNPVHLYNKLLKYNQLRNYEILSHWRRSEHGILRR